MKIRIALISCIALAALFPTMGEDAAKVKILLVGDSTTLGNLPRQVNPEGPHLEQMIEQLAAVEGLATLEVINAGKGGETAKRLLGSIWNEENIARVPDVDYLFIRLGNNKWLKPYTHLPKVRGGKPDELVVGVNDTSLDPIFGNIKGWYFDRHPNSAGYNLIAGETVKILAPIFRKRSHNKTEATGTTETGEGNELIIKSGLVVKEVAGAGKDELPRIAIGSADGHHFLYDPNKLAMEGVWSGQFGRLDAEGKLVPLAVGRKSFSLDRAPWSFGEKPRRECGREWKGYEIREGKVVLRYRLTDEESGMSWEIEESPEYVSEQLQHLHFHIVPSAKTDLYLNYWLHQTDFRRVTTNGQQNQRNLLKNLLPNQEDFTISFLRRKETPTIPHGYSVSAFDIPTPELPARFEPTGFDFAPDGSVYVSTRTGGVWRRKEDKWSLFADGLEEVNGVQIAPDGTGVYVMQKPELTLLRDTDHDGIADLYETVEDRFRFTGHYHEFAYGPRMNSKGDMFFSLGLSSSGHHSATEKKNNQMTSALGYRGWIMKHTAGGDLVPFASGLRSPAGIGMNDKDELFVTDNQGDWVASSYLGHVEEGDFLGQPASAWDLPEYGVTPRVLDYTNNAKTPENVPPLDLAKLAKIRKRPAVWLAHGDLTNSPGHPSFAPESGFGPFAGQAFIADIAHRNVIRVALEKVGGKYQGAAFPFIRPLRSAAYATRFDPQGNLWVGAVGRGWVAGDPAIEIIRYEPGSTPFEMHHIELTKEGFDIHFTEPLGPEVIEPRDLSITEFQYEYWDTYGSERFRDVSVPVNESTISTDRTTLSLHLSLKAEYIYEFQLPELGSRSGLRLENNFAYYTLNQLLP